MGWSSGVEKMGGGWVEMRKRERGRGTLTNQFWLWLLVAAQAGVHTSHLRVTCVDSAVLAASCFSPPPPPCVFCGEPKQPPRALGCDWPLEFVPLSPKQKGRRQAATAFLEGSRWKIEGVHSSVLLLRKKPEYRTSSAL